MSAPSKRGRPPKFGRPARLLAFTVPDDVRAWLGSIHDDPGWALVSLFERATATGSSAKEGRAVPAAEIALLAPRRGLIVVNRSAIPAIPGVALIPLSDTHAFLALAPGRGLADIELAVIDALDARIPVKNRRALTELRDRLKSWRNDPQWQFEPRAIVVAEYLGPSRKGAVQPRAKRVKKHIG